MRIPDRLVIASRGSRLALTQTNMVADLIRRAHPDVEIELLEITTQGDRDQRAFSDIGGKGLFTSEVERALIEGAADIAVHSAKDLTAELGPGCEIVCVPERASRHDVVVGGTGTSGEQRIAALAPGAKVGTSSMRRRALLAEYRKDLETVEFRGNLDTRLRKVASRTVDIAVLAAAGIERLGEHPGRHAVLDPDRWVPAPGQGCLAVEAMSSRSDIRGLLGPLEHPSSRAELDCERAFSERLEGGCSVPLGCTARVEGDRISATGYLGSPDGVAIRERFSGPVADASEIGIELAETILVSGGDSLLAGMRQVSGPAIDPP